MKTFSNTEYRDIHSFYGVVRGNTDEACRIFTEYFPFIRNPVANAFISLHNRLRETGSFKVKMHDTGFDRTVRTEDFEENVFECIVKNPSSTTRAEAHNLDTSTATYRVKRLKRWKFASDSSPKSPNVLPK